MEAQAKKALDQAVKDLAKQAHAHMIEFANSKLHSRRELFIENLSFHSEGDGVHVITLGSRAVWIDSGMGAHNQLDALLASPKAKHAADGSTYLVVPFDHSPGHGKTNTTPANLDLISTIKSEMKNRKIPWAKIEKDEHGQPKTGRLHSFDINQKPLKTAEGPGQGKGPVGTVRQGPTGISFLNNINVYQNKVKSADGTEKIKRSVMTFRIASSKHKSQGGRWDMPEIPGIFAFDETLDWVRKEWESKIAPQVLATLIAEIS
jgi:hypothetical protein